MEPSGESSKEKFNRVFCEQRGASPWRLDEITFFWVVKQRASRTLHDSARGWKRNRCLLSEDGKRWMKLRVRHATHSPWCRFQVYDTRNVRDSCFVFVTWEFCSGKTMKNSLLNLTSLYFEFYLSLIIEFKII